MERLVRLVSVLALLFLIAGPAAIAEEVKTPCDELTLGPVEDPTAYQAFRRLRKTTPATSEYQRARIDYLIERTRESSVEFIRNGVTHTSQQAAAHMRYKYARYRSDAPTAEAFVVSIASRSRKTGRSYLVKIGTETCELRVVLFNELGLLDRLLEEQRERTDSQLIS
ncbi:MAG TPA: DUF5329 family protein [Candidatus Omnitrophota bacterium]|jgi:hypothetical protein|nr:DUF5329 family protein [Candidatus Omnitrophota bacterium]HQB93706.1 DUF5329 family protein [Candidatus Omnitrophota bacterium]